VGNQAFVGLGIGAASLKDFYQFEPTGGRTDVWESRAPFPGVGRHYSSSFVIGDKIYVGLGTDNAGYPLDFWEYSTTTDTWTRKADFKGAGRVLAIGFSIGGKGYFTTGTDLNGVNKYKD